MGPSVVRGKIESPAYEQKYREVVKKWQLGLGKSMVNTEKNLDV